MNKIDLIITGLGGQGIVTATNIISDVIINSSGNYDFKLTDIVGLGQRGGSVISHVRIGNNVESPIIVKQNADFIIAFELLEAVKLIPYLNKNGKLLLNDYFISPFFNNKNNKQGLTKEKLFEQLDAYNIDYIKVSSIDILKNNQLPYVPNIFFLGMFASFLSFEMDEWIKSIQRTVKRDVSKNLSVFQYAFSYLSSN